MPNIPVTWLEEFKVTLGVNPQDPDIIQLANGNILVSWSSTDPARPGASGNEDTIGQIFDPLGNPVGSAFRINQGFFADDENNADLAATTTGGFIAVYQDVETTGVPLRLNVYDAAGAVLFTTTIESDSNSGTQPNFRDPHVEVSSSTSALIVYQVEDASGTRIAGRLYDPSTNTLGAQQSLIAFSSNESDPDVTALTNGNYVITCTDNTGGDPRIAFRIISAAGANVLGASFITSTSADGFTDNEASVTALTGGGFVISYTDRDSSDTDVAYSVFNAAGTQIASGLAGSTGGSITNDNNESVVSGLADGSFVIILDNDEADTMEATHVSAAGTVLGTFTFSGPGTEPSVTDLGDGRFAVTWESFTDGGGVKMEILDTRDFINNGVYSPNQQQIGTIFDDVFTADGISEIVHGWKGDDTITESGQIRSYFGDEGDDTLIVASPINSDVHDGGAGNDMIDWSTSGVVGAVFDLTAGTATQGVNTEVMVNFEKLIGTTGDDTITGTTVRNVLGGSDGNDVLDGGLGNDHLSGGTGTDRATYIHSAAGLVVNLTDATQNTGEATGDTYNSIENLTGSEFNDTLTGTAGTNSIIAGAGNDTVIGLAGNDNLFGQDGNDILNGGLGADFLNGGAGTDRVTYETAAAAVIASLSSPAGNTGEAAGDTYSSVENLTGSDFSDTLTGSSATNSIIGGTGSDTIIGLGGNDNLFGQDDNDVLNGGAGADVLNGGAGSDRVTYETAAAAVIASLSSPAGNTGEAAGDTYSSIENLTGSAFNDTLTGNNGTNSIIGGAGNDTLIGLAGSDNLFGQDGNDTLIGGVGADALSGGADTDTASYATAAAAVVASLTTPASNTGDAAGDTYSSIENLTGSAFNDTLTGNSAINVILGGNGNDTLNGRAGNDTMTGGAGNDNFLFDTAVGATNVDTITDFNFVNDTIQLDNAIFNAIIGVGTLTAAQFVANTSGTAVDAGDRIIYETDTGKIFYDTNGNAAGGSTQIASVTAGLGITNADFFIV